jgi:endoglucanase
MDTLHNRPRRLRRAVASAGAVALAAGGGIVALVAGQASAAAPACSVTYTVSSQWPGGFGASITIVNNASPINGWTLGFAFPAAGQAVTQGWNGTWSQSGANVTVASLSWNAAIATGGSVQLGFNGSWTGSNPAPTAFTLNGVACNGGSGGSPSPSASPSASASASASSSPSASASASASPSASPSGSSGGGSAPQLHVSGNKLVTSTGAAWTPHGVNRSGGEYECVQGYGVWDGPTDQASINAIKSWNANAVRVPLNEACWNGESYVPAADSGANYQNAVKSFVNLLNANGLVAILDLHWTDGTYTGSSAGCSSAQATCQKPMPDAAQAIPFWSSVASTFKNNDAVVFDLFNEPYASRADNNNSTEGWQCWETGSPCTGIGYPVAGMQQMVNAVRSAGANNVLMLGGEEYSNDLTGWLQYKPTDPDNNLVASFHDYNFNTCAPQSCWTSQIAPVIAKVPVIAGEIGENDCSGSFINPLMSWLDSQHTGYLAWTWDNWSGGCSTGPTLITDYNGTPTNFGAAYKAHISTLP